MHSEPCACIWQRSSSPHLLSFGKKKTETQGMAIRAKKMRLRWIHLARKYVAVDRLKSTDVAQSCTPTCVFRDPKRGNDHGVQRVCWLGEPDRKNPPFRSKTRPWVSPGRGKPLPSQWGANPPPFKGHPGLKIEHSFKACGVVFYSGGGPWHAFKQGGYRQVAFIRNAIWRPQGWPSDQGWPCLGPWPSKCRGGFPEGGKAAGWRPTRPKTSLPRHPSRVGCLGLGEESEQKTVFHAVHRAAYPHPLVGTGLVEPNKPRNYFPGERVGNGLWEYQRGDIRHSNRHSDDRAEVTSWSGAAPRASCTSVAWSGPTAGDGKATPMGVKPTGESSVKMTQVWKHYKSLTPV